jgi:LysR family transcriptional regulator, benzoate and cis,cis-muconate-responsive activator of ben and cat genes
MELKQLEMLVAVAEERSFLRAAERVFRTQPAVSIGIRKLEGQVGVPLLDRSGRGSGRLTLAGERLYNYARKILELRDEALAAVQREEATPERSLRVGIVGEENLARFPLVWKRFKERYTAVDVKLYSDDFASVLKELVSGRLDVALVSGRPRSEAEGKNLIVTRVRSGSGPGWLWVVRQKFGLSSLAHAFEIFLLEGAPLPVGRPQKKTLELGMARISLRRKGQ